ncbi:hypothetical protein PR729_17580 [Providencia rettgeri]|nr:hypothetical protein PR729_17580 [Providencia rettgeri]
MYIMHAMMKINMAIAVDVATMKAVIVTNIATTEMTIMVMTAMGTVNTATVKAVMVVDTVNAATAKAVMDMDMDMVNAATAKTVMVVDMVNAATAKAVMVVDMVMTAKEVVEEVKAYVVYSTMATFILWYFR